MTRALQKTILVGCRELGLDQEARRHLQLAVTGKASMSDMSESDLEAVLNRLKRAGFKPFKTGKSARTKRPKAPRADLRLIHVLWKKLGDAGQLQRPDRDGLNAFIRVRFGNIWGSVPADVDMLREWSQINDVIQALKNWGERAEIDFDWEDHLK